MRNNQLSDDWKSAICRIIDSGLDFAIYRFPEEREPHLVLQKKGRAEVLSDNVAEHTGFIFAPFSNTEHVPTLLIHPDVAVSGWELIEIESQKLGRKRATLSSIPLEGKHGDIDGSDSYKVAFRSFKNQLDKGEFQNLVLSYSQLVDWKYSRHEDELFISALEKFPSSMVYLVYTRQSGRWFGCLPELLLEGYGTKWKTMAMGDSNIQEHELLSDYIEGHLQGFNARIIRRGPYNTPLEDPRYLRTDFTFFTPTPKLPLEIISLLHPTPAVCGLPKDETWKFIRLFERNQRMYFGGFLGPLNLFAETKIYVNTRCCNIRPNGKALFFAGSNLTHESRLEFEKEKVKGKLNILKSLL